MYFLFDGVKIQMTGCLESKQIAVKTEGYSLYHCYRHYDVRYFHGYGFVI